MKKIHLFNPGNETEILLNTSNYTPPKNVRVMSSDLAYLPAWYADSEDLVLCEDAAVAEYINQLPAELNSILPQPKSVKNIREVLQQDSFEAAPWGVSPRMKSLYQKLKPQSTNGDLVLPQWDDKYIDLSGRQTAVSCFAKISESLCDLVLPAVPRICHSLTEVESVLTESSAKHLVKSPYSSSGRGLLWIKDDKLSDKDAEWIKGVLDRQGFIVVEQALDRISDFAMEFELSDNGTVEYKGLSLFDTDSSGSYQGNILMSEERIVKHIEESVGVGALSSIQLVWHDILKDCFAPYYNGNIGIDMFLYRQSDGAISINPCVEINMRNTMGRLSAELFRKYIYPEATGSYRLDFWSDSAVLNKFHESNKSENPLVFNEDGRIVSGYLSLCPVLEHTKFCAYILVK